jgi:hypothetical protein
VQETISLYLELKRDEKAEFEVVGLAAAAFAEAVKEIAYVVEPGIEVRLEFDSGTEGSLRLSAILKSLGTAEGRRTALLTVIVTVATTLAHDVASYGLNKFLDLFLTSEQRQQLSDEDIERIVRAMKKAADGKIAKEPLQQIFKQLERDEAIKGVGATTKPDAKPIRPVPRSDFAIRAGIVPTAETAPKTRTVRSVERLLLISPVLLAADRIWRLRSLFGEFGYHVDDEKFRDSLLSGRRRLPMKAGIQLTAHIDTQEVLEGGVWVPKERHIVKVVRVHRRPPERDLFSGSQKSKRREK